MKRKNMIAILISFTFVSMAIGVIATDSLPVELFGTGTATINNIEPSITGTAINDGATWVTYLDVDFEYLFYVNVSEANTLDDISEVTLEMWVTGNQATDDPAYRYKFTYTETTVNDGVFAGSWDQNMPTAGTYLNGVACATPALVTANSGSYVFAVTLEQNAKAGYWYNNVTTTDSTGSKDTKINEKFDVYKYLEMTYDTGGASQNFAWAGAVGDLDAADTFDVTVTANTPYTLSAAYENRFYNAASDEKWLNEPSLEVRPGVYSKVTLTNYTSSFAPWYLYSIPVIGHTTSHTMFLDFEAVLPALTYTGVTIYIQASV